MEKFGVNLPIIHQISHNQGIHLAVCEVIYKYELGFAEYDEDGDESDDEDNDNHQLSSDLIEFKLQGDSQFIDILTPLFSFDWADQS